MLKKKLVVLGLLFCLISQNIVVFAAVETENKYPDYAHTF